MTRKLAGIIILLSGFSFLAVGQIKSNKKTSRPDIPGTFTLEFGFNQDLSGPSDFDLSFWGSRTFNFYYQYELRILKSPISLVPGIGLSLERFKFKNNAIVGYNGDGEIAMIPQVDTDFEDIRKSMLITNFVEMPLELRYTMKPDDPTRSFKIAVGGRVGWLYDSFMKIKYKEDGEIKKLKDKQDYKLTQVRYGLTGRIGYGNLSLFTYYNLTPLFEEGKGLQTNNASNDFNTITFGISLSSF